jgi:hypothetical protein
LLMPYWVGGACSDVIAGGPNIVLFALFQTQCSSSLTGNDLGVYLIHCALVNVVLAAD